MTEEHYECPIGISDEYYRLIGIIAAQWERLSFCLEWAVAEIGMHDPVRVGLLTNNLTYTAKIELLLTYAAPLEQHDKKSWKELFDCIQEIRRVNNLRNNYVHARWIPAETSGSPAERSVVRTTHGKLDIGNKPTPLSELVIAAKDIYSVGEKFMAIMNSHGLLNRVPTSKES
jgi:hypothetical protein